MALVTCPDCKKEISDAAPACPNCGRPKDTPPPSVPSVRCCATCGRILGSGEQTVCAKCSARVVITAEATSAGAKQGSGPGSGCLKGCLGLVVLWLISTVVCVMLPGSTTSSGSSGPTETQAFIICKTFVENGLKSPKSADFPLFDHDVTKLGGSSFSVSSYVDAQNSFGATIRTNFTCRVTHKGGDWAEVGNWNLDGLTFSQ